MFKKSFKGVSSRASKKHALCALATGLGFAQAGFAIDVDSGDWIAPPPDANLFLLYGQHTKRNSLYTSGTKTPDAKLTSDVTILRYVRPMKWGDYIIAPQILAPFGRLRAGDSVAALGSTTGVADLIFSMPVWILHDNAARNTFAIAPYLFVPTGSYDKNRALNLGENRWKTALQIGGSFGIHKNFSIEVTGDVTFFGENNDFGQASTTLKQKPLYQYQSYFNWHQSPGTTFAFGLSHATGGEQRVNDVAMNNRTSTTKALLTGSTFVSPANQVMVSIGRDLSVENGFKEEARVNLRFLHVF